MSELSPAAQAVLDTMHRSYDHEPTRRALADAADAADAAADADADAAEAAARLRQRDLLLRLIAEAPVVENHQ